MCAMPHRLTNRARVALAVAASIVPAAVLAAVLVGYDTYTRERERILRDTTGTARALIAGVDDKLEEVQAVLSVLGGSPMLQAGDFARFHARAAVAAKQLGLVNIVLTDSAGPQRLNTFVPFGSPLPQTTHPTLVGVARDGKPAMTDVFRAQVSKRWLVGVGVPVQVKGERYSLNAGLPAERLQQVLMRQRLPADWIAAVFDRSGNIAARTHAPERFVGGKGSPELVKRIAEIDEGVIYSQTLEGTPVVSVFSRSPMSGWTVAIGIPQAELLHAAWNSMARVAIIAFLLMGTALLLAVWIAARLWPGDRRAG